MDKERAICALVGGSSASRNTPDPLEAVSLAVVRASIEERWIRQIIAQLETVMLHSKTCFSLANVLPLVPIFPVLQHWTGDTTVFPTQGSVPDGGG